MISLIRIRAVCAIYLHMYIKYVEMTFFRAQPAVMFTVYTFLHANLVVWIKIKHTRGDGVATQTHTFGYN